ncbi:MAG: GNAT family N-acetyltransferase [Paracoccaceae bacterium]
MTGWAEVMEATWPPAAVRDLGPWRLRDGAGGGKRVSAATAEGAWTTGDLALAEAAMAQPLFQIRQGDGALDAALDARGYRLIDPVVVYEAAVTGFDAPPPMTTFPHWPPLEIAVGLWAAAGIGPARLAVMHRALGPKVAILARAKDRVAGVAYVALHGTTAMLHALEVAPNLRRQGCAQNILRAAAVWGRENGADVLTLVVTEANAGARNLYASLNMQVVGSYHYREK